MLPGLYLFLGKTRGEARDMYEEADAHWNTARRFAAVQSVLGVDWSRLPLDQPVTADGLPDPLQPVRSRTHAELLRRRIVRERPTVKELLSRPEVVASGHWVVVGTVEDALAEILQWVEAEALDGFIVSPGGSLQSFVLFCGELVPALADQGLFRTEYTGEYTGTTLREHLANT